MFLHNNEAAKDVPEFNGSPHVLHMKDPMSDPAVGGRSSRRKRKKHCRQHEFGSRKNNDLAEYRGKIACRLALWHAVSYLRPRPLAGDRGNRPAPSSSIPAVWLLTDQLKAPQREHGTKNATLPMKICFERHCVG